MCTPILKKYTIFHVMLTNTNVMSNGAILLLLKYEIKCIYKWQKPQLFDMVYRMTLEMNLT